VLQNAGSVFGGKFAADYCCARGELLDASVALHGMAPGHMHGAQSPYPFQRGYMYSTA